MPYNSFNFWLIFPFIFGLYWLIPAKYNQWRKVFLVLVSIFLKPYKNLSTLNQPPTLNSKP